MQKARVQDAERACTNPEPCDLAMRSLRYRPRALASEPMSWLTAVLRRPPIGWWDHRRHPRGVAPHLRGAQADSRHARGADGARRRRPGRAVLRVAAGAISKPSTGSSGTCSATSSSRSSCCFSPTSAARWRIWAARRSSATSPSRSRRRNRSRSWSSPPSMLSAAAHRRDHRDRAADRAAQLHRGRHSARRRR